MTRDIIAILSSDLHLSHKPPAARCTEKNWYQAQSRLLRQVSALQDSYGVPWVIAGDIFDDGWRPHKCPPELVNLALEHIDRAFAVVGQHDIPFHNLKDIKRSAYWTLVLAGKLTDLSYGEPVTISGANPVRLHGFPWGTPLKHCWDPNDLMVEVAVVHHYCWVEGHGFPGADIADRADKLANTLKGYDVAVFGDNHSPVRLKPTVPGRPLIFGPGGFQRRRRDEMGHRPSVGLLRADGSVGRHYLDVNADVFADAQETAHALAAGTIDTSAVIEELNQAADADLDFAEALRAALRKQPDLSTGVRRWVLSALDGETGR